jgi:plastocyanin
MSQHRVCRIVMILAALSPIAFHGCTSEPGPTDAAATVTTRNMTFAPQSVTIQAGQSVRWFNNDITFHTVTSGNPGDPNAGSLFDSGNILPNQSFEHTFNDKGTFVYFCRVHSTMMFGATVIVQ